MIFSNDKTFDVNIEEIIKHLIKGEKSFTDTIFSKNPGIYAIFFRGDEFPMLGNLVKKHQLIYVGKTESSQEKRDAKTHFSDGKTGSSTVRKSIGALLYNDGYELHPIPRNDKDVLNNRFSHFIFDDNGEKVLTKWMKDNLSLSFYEYDIDKASMKYLETNIIQAIIPILNIQENPHNAFRSKLRELRKNCADYAHEDAKDLCSKNENLRFSREVIVSNGITASSNTHKYESIWRERLTEIIAALKKSRSKQFIYMNADSFLRVGNRSKTGYSFKLEYLESKIINLTPNTAVARDLDRILSQSSIVLEILSKGHYKVSMDKSFCLCIQKLS